MYDYFANVKFDSDVIYCYILYLLIIL